MLRSVVPFNLNIYNCVHYACVQMFIIIHIRRNSINIGYYLSANGLIEINSAGALLGSARAV